LTFAQLRKRVPPDARPGLRAALDAAVAEGQMRCEHGVYSLITEALRRDVLAAFIALADEPAPVAASNGKVQRAAGWRSPLAAEVAALLTEESTGLPCATVATRLHRRPAAVLAALRSHPCFVRQGRTRGARWRVTAEAMASLGSGRNGKEWEPALGLALGHLALNRLEAAERELTSLKAQLSEQGEPAA
jgi:hypothetical protein